MYDMGGAAVILHPDGTKINLIQPGNVSASGDLYEKFSTFCNNEISKAVNGNTLTTEAGEKGTQALGAVQQEGEIDIAFFIKRSILNILNYEVTDVFTAMGINTQGGKFAFAPPKERDLKTRIEIECKLKNDFELPFDDDYLYEEYGVRKPANYDALKAAKQAAAQTNEPEPLLSQPKNRTERGLKDEKPQTIRNAFRSFFGCALEDPGAGSDW